jgi:hypothetical protein
MEAPGIEPGSRGTSALTSTCVACHCSGPTQWPPRVHPQQPATRWVCGGLSARLFSRCRRRSESGCPDPQAPAILNWRPDRTLSGEGYGAARGSYAARENCVSAVVVRSAFYEANRSTSARCPSASLARSKPNRPRHTLFYRRLLHQPTAQSSVLDRSNRLFGDSITGFRVFSYSNGRGILEWKN